MKTTKQKPYDVVTVLGGTNHFFTMASSHKKALMNMINRSRDFKSATERDEPFTITVKRLRK